MINDLSLESIINTILIILGFSITVFFLWRTKATDIYKEAVSAYEIRLKQVEQDVTNLTVENKDLQARLNQMIGENTALKKVTVIPDKAYQETTTSILKEIKTIREDFTKHSKQDDVRFAVIGDNVKANHDILKRIVTEQYDSRPIHSNMSEPVKGVI